jgi:hypothetical protein
VENSATSIELEKLADLRDRGVLTQPEFEVQRSRVLDRPLDDEAAGSEHVDVVPPPRRRRHRMAEGSNFTAVLALLCAIACWPAGIVLGFQARREAERSGDRASLALAAIVVAMVAGSATIIYVAVRVAT